MSGTKEIADKIRIAFDHQAFCRQPYTGISRYFTHLIQHLSVDGHCEPKVFAPLYVNRLLPTLPSQLVSGYHIHRHPRITRPIIREASSFLVTPAISTWKPHVIHETYYSEHRTGPNGVPIVVTVYDMIHELFPENFSRFDPIRRLKKKSITRAAHVICISHSTQKDLMSLLDVPQEKVSVIHLGITAHPVETLADTAIAKDSVRRPYLLYVGQRGLYKNFDRLIRAYASSQHLLSNFDVVCFGGGAFSRQEQDLIRSLGIASHVRQIGGDDNVLATLYAGAEVFVYPSLYEGFGLPTLEAMALGCPVVCSNTSSLPEVVGDAGIYCDPQEIESICSAMESVVGSASVRKTLIQKGFRRVSEFSWKRCALETERVYQGLR